MSPGSLLDMPILDLSPDLLSENLHFNMIRGGSACTLQFNMHWSRAMDGAPQVGLVVKTRLPMQETYEIQFDPWVRKVPWRRAWQPTPVFLPGESHGERSLEGYSPWGRKELDKTEVI